MFIIGIGGIDQWLDYLAQGWKFWVHTYSLVNGLLSQPIGLIAPTTLRLRKSHKLEFLDLTLFKGSSH